MKGNSILKFVFLLGLSTVIFMACKSESETKGYVISGSIKGLDTGWVKMVRPNYAERGALPQVIDSAQIHQGVFEFKGQVDYVDMVNLRFSEKYTTLRGFLLENSEVKLSLDIATADKYGQLEPEVEGAKFQAYLDEQIEKDINIFKKEKYKEIDVLRADMLEAYESKDEKRIAEVKERQLGLIDLVEERQREYQQSKITYVKEHPDSPVSPYVLGFQFSEGRMDKETMDAVYKTFEGAAKETAMFAYYKKIYTEIFESLGIGATAPDFVLKSVEGNEIRLSEVNGKVILVDFWASWCVPCRASFPHLKKQYEKYKNDGFEVVAVGTADIGANWKQAIKADETNWIHVFDGDYDLKSDTKTASYGIVAQLYGVPFLPTTFLLDENGTILGRNLPKEELDQKLEELFGH